MNPEFKKYKFNLVLFGQGAVGKSSLVLRYHSNSFTPEYIPTIQDTFRKNVVVDEKMVQLEILDTAGQEQYSQLLEYWIQKGDGFLLCYSTTSLESFREVETLKTQILAAKEERPLVLLVGTKADLTDEKKVDFNMAKQYSISNKFELIETSAKTGQNCTEAFSQIIRLLIQKQDEKSPVQKEKEMNFFQKYCQLI